MSTYFLAIDFEKNGLNTDPIFEVSMKLEAIEVTYHHVIILSYLYCQILIMSSFLYSRVCIVFFLFSVCYGGDYKLFQI